MTGKKRIKPEDLDIDLSDAQPQQLFRWFLACLLFGRPIQQEIAADAYRLLISKGFTSPKKFGEIEREPLRLLLDEAKYARYDYVTADELHQVMDAVIRDYGSVNHLVKSAGSAAQLEQRLKEFKGIGEKTAGIFMEEVPKKFNGTK